MQSKEPLHYSQVSPNFLSLFNRLSDHLKPMRILNFSSSVHVLVLQVLAHQMLCNDTEIYQYRAAQQCLHSSWESEHPLQIALIGATVSPPDHFEDPHQSSQSFVDRWKFSTRARWHACFCTLLATFYLLQGCFLVVELDCEVVIAKLQSLGWASGHVLSLSLLLLWGHSAEQRVMSVLLMMFVRSAEVSSSFLFPLYLEISAPVSTGVLFSLTIVYCLRMSPLYLQREGKNQSTGSRKSSGLSHILGQRRFSCRWPGGDSVWLQCATSQQGVTRPYRLDLSRSFSGAKFLAVASKIQSTQNPALSATVPWHGTWGDSKT